MEGTWVGYYVVNIFLVEIVDSFLYFVYLLLENIENQKVYEYTNKYYQSAEKRA